MSHSPPAPKVFRLGPFEFDPRSGHLRSEGHTHRLADQPLALLNALLERPGEMVTREELRGRLWPDGTFVDFDHGLNSAVSRLREALNDSANTPRFVETIPRRGYRLLVPVEVDGQAVVNDVTPAEPLPAVASMQSAASSDVGEPATAWWGRRRTAVWMSVAAIALVIVGVGGTLQLRRDAKAAGLVTNVVIDLPDEWRSLNESPAISPDSRHVVFSAFHRTGRRGIWHRPLDTGAARLLNGTQDGTAPFWSPDGKSIGFFAEGKLKTTRLDDTPVRVVADAPPGASGTWMSADVILFAPGETGAVYQTNVATGLVRPITEVDRSTGEIRHVRPTALPDTRHFVYLANRKDTFIATLASMDGSGAVPLGAVQSHVVATPSGHVVFVRDRALLAQRLDVAAGRLTGDVTVLANGPTLPGPAFGFSASTGMLVYATTSGIDLSELRIIDRSGKTVGTLGEPALYFSPSLSPDGTRLAVARIDNDSTVKTRDIWVFDLARGSQIRLTLDPGHDIAPEWSSDGRWLMFSSDRRGVRDIYKRLASGEGVDEIVFESEIPKSVNAWSPDGRFVVYDTGVAGLTDSDLHILPLVGDRRPVVLDSRPGFQAQAAISPDGRLIAYQSSESGQYEVIVQSFPESSGRRQISTNGGREPRWRGDGRELFFLSDDALMAVDVHTSTAGLEWSVPRTLFRIPNYQRVPRGFVVSADGQRFIAVVSTTRPGQQRFTTVLNWTSLIK